MTNFTPTKEEQGIKFNVGNVTIEWREGLKLEKRHLDTLMKALTLAEERGAYKIIEQLKKELPAKDTGFNLCLDRVYRTLDDLTPPHNDTTV